MTKIIIIILLIYLIYKMPQFIEPFSKEKENEKSFTKKDTLDALENYPDKSIDLLYDAKFKPECCPNFYSNSNGCPCMTTDQYNYLQTRGGNNVPYSEY